MSSETELRKFLETELPRKNRDQVESVMGVLDRASLRYERYCKNRSQWKSYRDRKKILSDLSEHAKKARWAFEGIDLISKDDLADLLGGEEVEKIDGFLANLEFRSSQVADKVQKSGAPKDLAEERWVCEVARIYKTNFGKKATVSGSGSGPPAKRGKFYKLLVLSRPNSHPLHGSFHPRQVKRILARCDRV